MVCACLPTRNYRVRPPSSTLCNLLSNAMDTLWLSLQMQACACIRSVALYLACALGPLALPAGRLGVPEDMAGPALFLASRASDCELTRLTGSTRATMRRKLSWAQLQCLQLFGDGGLAGAPATCAAVRAAQTSPAPRSWWMAGAFRCPCWGDRRGLTCKHHLAARASRTLDQAGCPGRVLLVMSQV